MTSRYLENKTINLNHEIDLAYQVLEHMRKDGLKDFSITNVDFNFISNNKNKLNDLKFELEKEFSIRVEYLKKLSIFKSEYELSIEIQNIIVTEELLIYLIAYIFKKAIKNDCEFGDWGALINDKMLNINDIDDDETINNGYKAYDEMKLYSSLQSFYLIASKSNSAECYYNLGCIKYDLGFINDSINSYSEAIKIDPENLLPYLNRGVAYYDINEFERAIEDYKVIIQAEPGNPDPYINVANAYIELGIKDLAIENYNKAIELGSNDAIVAKEHGLNRLSNKEI